MGVLKFPPTGTQASASIPKASAADKMFKSDADGWPTVEIDVPGGGTLVTYAVEIVTPAAGAADYDLALSHHFYSGVTADVTAITLSNVPATGAEWIEWTVRYGHEGAAGAHTVTFPSAYRMPGGVKSFAIDENEYLEVVLKTSGLVTSASAVVVS